MMAMSNYPMESANNPDCNDEWIASDELCPNCDDVYMWKAGWWDDTPEAGGGCIGTKYKCGNCNHYESF